MTEPVIKVGIMQATTLQFNLSGSFRVDDTIVEGPQTACLNNGNMEWKNQSYNELIFLPPEQESFYFELIVLVILQQDSFYESFAMTPMDRNYSVLIFILNLFYN